MQNENNQDKIFYEWHNPKFLLKFGFRLMYIDIRKFYLKLKEKNGDREL